jgi:hypothetical protein
MSLQKFARNCYIFTNFPIEIQQHIQIYLDNPLEISRKYHNLITYRGIINILKTRQNLDLNSDLYYYYTKKIIEGLQTIKGDVFYSQNIDAVILLFSRDKYQNVRSLPRYGYLEELKKVFEHLCFLEYNPFERRGY